MAAGAVKAVNSPYATVHRDDSQNYGGGGASGGVPATGGATAGESTTHIRFYIPDLDQQVFNFCRSIVCCVVAVVVDYIIVEFWFN